MKVQLITLGCSKNRVDSEHLLCQIAASGIEICPEDTPLDLGGADVVILNTCGFIADAKQESVEAILRAVKAKKEGYISRIYVFGCLSRRYYKELVAEIPEVDGFFGLDDEKPLLAALGVKYSPALAARRHLTTPRHYAYLKISEGCDRSCAYCAIPGIRGPHVSVDMDTLADEARSLAAQGVKELIVVAQDTTYYGLDTHRKRMIAPLLDRLSQTEGIEWIRLHYAYPTHFPWELLRVMREEKNVCNYLDIALQHITDRMLGRMRRNVTQKETYELVERLRKEVPGIHLRTTLMVGFPGETDKDFEELVKFTRWARFERMGAFAYSEEEGTYSEQNYEDDVPEEVKQARLDKLMRIQQNISAEIEAAKIGSVQRVIIDRREGDYYIGRTEFCSPEVDPEVLIPANGQALSAGNFYNVRITDSEEFDLYGTIDSQINNMD